MTTEEVDPLMLPNGSYRPVRFLLPISLAKRLDDAVSRGLGGHADRHALGSAALDEYLIELEYSDQSGPVLATPEGPAAVLDPGSPRPAIRVPMRGTPAEDRLSDLRDEPLLGLHNRDWPSLWALAELAHETVDGPVPLREFLLEATSKAWKIADGIRDEAGADVRKLTALLPTNREKPQSAESMFQEFGIISVARRPDPNGNFRVGGPLALWRTLALIPGHGSTLLTGVTKQGWELLEIADGLTPSLRQPEDRARLFLSFLRTKVPIDWWGFRLLLDTVKSGPSRETLVAAFAAARPWKRSVGASAAQGHLARAREWGLVEHQLVDGSYLLTDFGREIQSGG